MAAVTGIRRLAFRVMIAWLAFAPIVVSGGESSPASGFVIDQETSRVYARVDALRIGHNHGVEGRLVEGKLLPGGTGKLVFDMTSFVCDTPAAREYVGLTGEVSASDRRKTTENMQSKYVLDTASHERATFTANKFEALDGQANGAPGRYQLSGQFTLHGVAKPISFEATVDKVEGSTEVRIRGTFSILQTDHGIKPYSAFGGIAKIENRIQIWGDLRAKPAP